MKCKRQQFRGDGFFLPCFGVFIFLMFCSVFFQCFTNFFVEGFVQYAASFNMCSVKTLRLNYTQCVYQYKKLRWSMYRLRCSIVNCYVFKYNKSCLFIVLQSMLFNI